MGTKLTELTISFNKRNARYRGPTSSYTWNDSIEEISRDFNTIYNLWNDSLFPLLALIPDGTVDGNINAYAAGLDGRTLYVNSESTLVKANAYYNIGKSRPNTLYEQLQSVYQYVDSKVNVVQEQVISSSSGAAAADVPIADSGDIITANNVEDALQEIMNLVVRTGTSHSALNNLSADDHTQYLPRNGVRAMTGTLQLGGQNINNINNIAGASTGTIDGFTLINVTQATIGASGITTTGNASVTGTVNIGSGPQQIYENSSALYIGKALAKRKVVVLNAGSTTSPDVTLTRTLYHNIDTSTEETLVLPAATGSGVEFSIIADEPFTVDTPAGDTIRVGANESISGGTAVSTAAGNTLTVVDIAVNRWVALSYTGTWTVT